MPRTTIDSIVKSGDKIYIRSGREEYEIDGGIAGLQAWASEQTARSDKLVVIGSAVNEHLRTDPTLNDPRAIVLRDLDIVLSNKPRGQQ